MALLHRREANGPNDFTDPLAPLIIRQRRATPPPPSTTATHNKRNRRVRFKQLASHHQHIVNHATSHHTAGSSRISTIFGTVVIFGLAFAAFHTALARPPTLLENRLFEEKMSLRTVWEQLLQERINATTINFDSASGKGGYGSSKHAPDDSSVVVTVELEPNQRHIILNISGSANDEGVLHRISLGDKNSSMENVLEQESIHHVHLLKLNVHGFLPTLFDKPSQLIRHQRVNFMIFTYGPRQMDDLSTAGGQPNNNSSNKACVGAAFLDTLVQSGYMLYHLQVEASSPWKTIISHRLVQKSRPTHNLMENCLWYLNLEQMYYKSNGNATYFTNIVAVSPKARLRIRKPRTHVGKVLLSSFKNQRRRPQRKIKKYH